MNTLIELGYKERVLKLDKIRNTSIENILKKDPRVLKWWNAI